jgi:hypothetical protein
MVRQASGQELAVPMQDILQRGGIWHVLHRQVASRHSTVSSPFRNLQRAQNSLFCVLIPLPNFLPSSVCLLVPVVLIHPL